ncbi:lysM and putative peptidoglycan-binding domain-containing protein 2 [Venturia canescens]|uniref:lysM and putative peptidoglycan-binding domain-containing protein 2 n=1 Tax=Venturia canescens TaxID=32260 RepID=UPI001C9C8F05|nr:lysM and putative peptidoglycan-binding domain-containing protein 2 [Venturia canescens]
MDHNDDGEMEERRSIRDPSRKPKKYGSTSKHMTRNENLVKHIVSKCDTLQGIALKYGVTTEQIRRINRLWASDSLFLREYLLVPVPADCVSPMSGAESPASSTDTNAALSNSFNSTPVTSPNEDGASITDFLAKMDCSIASVKNEVRRVQGSSEFCYDGETTHVQRRKATARLRNSHPVTSSTMSENTEQLRPLSSNDVHSLPSAVVMTQGRRVKTSLQKLQQQQDEIFQL